MITEEELNKGFLTLKMIWLAMLASLAIYVFVGLQVAPTMRTSLDKDIFAILRAILYVLAFVTLIITGPIKRRLLSAKGQLGSAQSTLHPIIQQYFAAMTIVWALSESIGVYGLVLFFLGKNTTDLYLLIVTSAAALLMHRPKKGEVISLSQKSMGDATG
jgi:hypothetical protein